MEQRIDKLPSTIVIGVLLIVALFFTGLLLPFNLQESIKAVSESAQSSAAASEDPAGASVAGGFAALFGGMALVIVAFFLVLIPAVSSGVLLPFAIHNRKAETKPIRIINFVYIGVIATILTICIVKAILFLTGVA